MSLPHYSKNSSQTIHSSGSIFTHHLQFIPKVRKLSTSLIHRKQIIKSLMKPYSHIRHQTQKMPDTQKSSLRYLQKQQLSLSQTGKGDLLEEIILDKYKLIKLIGKGTFGRVFEGIQLKSGKKVAIKHILQDNRFQNRQLDIMRAVQHQNIVQIIDHIYITKNKSRHLYIIMKKYDYDLYTGIIRYTIDPKLIKIYLYQILRGLEYLKSHSIAHRDLKPHNILIDEIKSQAVICDFGSAKKLLIQQKNVSYICARCYRAPQLILGSNYYEPAVDMWSFGCIAAEIFNKKPLFYGSSNMEQIIKIIENLGTPTTQDMTDMLLGGESKITFGYDVINRKSIKQFISSNDNKFLDLLDKILIYSPSKRYTPTQALNHPYFNSLKQPKRANNFQINRSKNGFITKKFRFQKYGLNGDDLQKLQNIKVANINPIGIQKFQ